MATSKPDFLGDEAFSGKTPQYDQEPRRPRGCFFYGCLLSSVLVLLMVIGVGMFSYLAYRSLVEFVEANTATEPTELPKVDLPEAAQRSLKERIESFEKAVDAGEATEPLVLTASDLNALIQEKPDWKGQVYLTIDGEKIGGKVSIRLDSLGDALGPMGFGLLQGRYLNGQVQLKTTFKDGILNITVESLEVNGKPLSSEYMNLVKESAVEFSNDTTFTEKTRKIESLEVKDSKIIIRGRALKKGPEPGTSRPLPDLPEDVLAPAVATPPR